MAAKQGDQRKAIGAKDCFPSLIGHDIAKDEHFSAAGKVTIPWSCTGNVDYDLQLTAYDTIAHINNLRLRRHEAMEVFAELARRCEP